MRKARDRGIVERYIRKLYEPEDVNPRMAGRMDEELVEPTKEYAGGAAQEDGGEGERAGG